MAGISRGSLSGVDEVHLHGIVLDCLYRSDVGPTVVKLSCEEIGVCGWFYIINIINMKQP